MLDWVWKNNTQPKQSGVFRIWIEQFSSKLGWRYCQVKRQWMPKEERRNTLTIVADATSKRGASQSIPPPPPGATQPPHQVDRTKHTHQHNKHRYPRPNLPPNQSFPLRQSPHSPAWPVDRRQLAGTTGWYPGFLPSPSRASCCCSTKW